MERCKLLRAKHLVMYLIDQVANLRRELDVIAQRMVFGSLLWSDRNNKQHNNIYGPKKQDSIVGDRDSDCGGGGGAVSSMAKGTAKEGKGRTGRKGKEGKGRTGRKGKEGKGRTGRKGKDRARVQGTVSVERTRADEPPRPGNDAVLHSVDQNDWPKGCVVDPNIGKVFWN